MVMKCHESIGYAKFIWKIMFCDYVQMISTALMISRHPFRYVVKFCWVQITLRWLFIFVPFKVKLSLMLVLLLLFDGVLRM